jgi:hypothetical protein
MWQIQLRFSNGGMEWAPISLDRSKLLVGGGSERRYHYDTRAEAEEAWRLYCEIEGHLAQTVRDFCAVRFIEVRS